MNLHLESTARADAPPLMLGPGTQAGKGARSPQLDKMCERSIYSAGRFRGFTEGLIMGGITGIIGMVVLILSR